MNLNTEDLQRALRKIAGSPPQITIVGDLILDEYLIGSPERISREAPVLILEHRERVHRLGGAANAALNAAKLGAQVILIGVLGADHSGQILQELCQQAGIQLRAVYSESRPTTVKTRILSANQSVQLAKAGTGAVQQVLRIDTLTREPLSTEEGEKLLALLPNESKGTILLSDYSLGVLENESITRCLQSGAQVVVDPSQDFGAFRGCHLITPNQPDTERELGQAYQLDEPTQRGHLLERLGQLLPNSNYLITRGAEGMLLLEGEQAHYLDAFNKAEVFDVTGAGDTVAACVSLALAAGVDLLSSAALGNLAASIVVRKAGSATTSLSELQEALQQLKAIAYRQETA